MHKRRTKTTRQFTLRFNHQSEKTSSKMYIIRCLFVALLVALASGQYRDEKKEARAYCICNNPSGATGVAWFGGCHSGYAYCGGPAPPMCVCCKKL